MILEIRPLSAGNALQLTLQPPAGALLTRVLRKPVQTFSGPDDADALVAYEGHETVIVDVAPGLVNERPAWYQAYFFMPSRTWQASAAASGTPTATYEDASTDAQSLLRDRLEAGLAVEVARSNLQAGASGAIAVLTAPPSAEETDWPVATVQLQTEHPSERAVGEILETDYFDPVAQKWVSSEGWLAEVSCLVAGWCLNPDERIEMRKALRRVIVANLAVFEAAGMVNVEIQASDAEFLSGEFQSNVYQTTLAVSCKAPVIVREKSDPIVDVVTTATPYPLFN